MWFKNLKVFRLSPSWSPSVDQLQPMLAKLAFAGGSSQEMQTLGWISPCENDQLIHSVTGHYLLSLRVENKLPPSTVINQVARAQAQEIEEQQSNKPERQQRKDNKKQEGD